MERLKQLQPWQIIAIALSTLVVVAIVSYFLVTNLTEPAAPKTGTSAIPAQLDSDANKKVIEDLRNFRRTGSGQVVPQPLRSADPNSPSQINPFTR